MNFIEICEKRFNSTNSILCVGLDPVIEKFPKKYQTGDIENDIFGYFNEIICNFNHSISVIKPNIAFYEQYGINGLKSLYRIIDSAKNKNIPVILDAKRGDIGNTAKAYAKSVFEDYNCDAVTLSPYLGEDSLEPFFQYKERGFFVLCRTSNRGSSDFQLQQIGNKYLFEVVAEKITDWNSKYSTGIGAVIGATQIEELKKITEYFYKYDCPPLLIPGVGTQGGDLKTVLSILKNTNYPLGRVFINSSSKITYSHALDDSNYLSVIENEIKKMII